MNGGITLLTYEEKINIKIARAALKSKAMLNQHIAREIIETLERVVERAELALNGKASPKKKKLEIPADLRAELDPDEAVEA